MDNSGFLDFKEFLLAMDLVAARTVEEKLLWCFKLYDTDNSGVIDKNEMANIMESVYNMLEGVKARPDDDPKERARRAAAKRKQKEAEAALANNKSKIPVIWYLLSQFYLIFSKLDVTL